MRRTGKIKWLKALLVAIVFAAIFCVTFILNRAYIKKNTDMVTVAVASKKLPAYSLLGREQTALAKVPRSMVPREAVLEPDTYFLGKTYFIGDLGFGEGDIIRTDRLTDGSISIVGNLARLDEEQKMLVAVNTNLIKSCANLVTPGTLVNAVVFIKGDNLNSSDVIISSAEDPRLASLLVIDKKNAEATATAEKGRDAIPAVITLVLDRSDIDVAKALVRYNERGSIYLLPIGFRSDIFLASQAK